MGFVLRRWAVVLATGAALLAQTAWAQFPGGGFPGGGYPRADRGGRVPSDRMPQRGEQRQTPYEGATGTVEMRLGMLEDDLHLGPEQMSAWRAYSGKVLALASDLARERAQAAASTPGGTNALQQIERVVNLERNRLTALEDIASVARVLYDSLTPEQRALADTRMATVIPSAAGFGGPAAGAPPRRPRGGEDRGRYQPGEPR